MRSIHDVYKIGRGPSSSHTMGPARAAALFREETPEADAYRAVLYGSLSKTGKGHGTDRILTETFAPLPAEIVFSPETVEKHPNTLDLTALRGGQELRTRRVYSVGGGDLEWEGGPAPGQEQEIYFENSFAEIKEFCEFRYISLIDYVELNEGAGIWDDLLEVWDVMRASIQEGLAASGELPGGLRIERKAKSIHDHILVNKHPEIVECQRVCSYAYAVSEQNAGNGRIVTAPTCGSCGVLPAVLYYFQDKRGLSDLDIVHALGVAGLFGGLAKRNASVSGAECGCQAEIGVACAMAAAALGQLFGYSIKRIEYAAEVALEHHLGLTCDPICGLVQIPCIERNAVAAMRAINSANLAYFLAETRRISYDMVIKTMYETGIHLSKSYRETSEGGLARLYSRRG
ncbi:L-serine ammonia-lyase, iron-sulfur-dependent, subunit alpha [uncultured Oscillibacter sp.]|jgi:L-serine dehydratase|uniref:L-serine ammonia-lyase, iron-sulfur-dependent, subunit alpha n=1 Tax=uncultured Oscillibacter sp. TaxID=876091 RepID=UPI0025EB70AC|nr:L-serine ammonia-lyase, iron-sulfur-dependent, subunit alpha [uncultured Oscillibacter sp.]